MTLFESGAIVHHIAENHPGLFPKDPRARALAVVWMFASLSTLEPPIVEYTMCLLFERDKPWFAERSSLLEERVRTRLTELSKRLGEADWLDGAFSAGDLMMVTVLRRLASSGLLEHYPKLSAYIAHAEARPAYQKAFADQLAVFNEQNR